MIEWVVMGLLFVLICLLIPRSDRGGKRFLPLLRELDRSKLKLLVRPDGRVEGVIEGEKPWWDERNRVKRRRFVYLDLKGETREEPRDRVKKSGEIEDVVPIEREGGIALTELLGSERRPVYVGDLPSRLRSMEEDWEVLDRNIQRQNKRVQSFRKRVQRLEGELSVLRDENGELRRTRTELEKGIPNWKVKTPSLGGR